jgi:hypothetical protein
MALSKEIWPGRRRLAHAIDAVVPISQAERSGLGHGRRFGTTRVCFSTVSVSRPSASATDKPLECQQETFAEPPRNRRSRPLSGLSPDDASCPLSCSLPGPFARCGRQTWTIIGQRRNGRSDQLVQSTSPVVVLARNTSAMSEALLNLISTSESFCRSRTWSRNDLRT